MKAENLCKLRENGFQVPKFIVVDKKNTSIDMKFSSCNLFAVRSSYGGEDSSGNSYAGQFDTFLNVPREQVPEVVQKVFESVSKDNAKEYEKAFSIQEDKEMKIIIQEMVEADYSGVFFTANPLGPLNEMVAVVGKGLGNNVVEDKIAVSTYYFHTEDKLYYCEKKEAAEGFREAVFLQLVEECKKIEELYGKKMDIEFAVRNDEIFILQARPITTLKEGETIILDNSNIVESYPGISLPLTISFAKEIYYKVFKNCVYRLTKDKAVVEKNDGVLQNMVDSANGRIYYRISNWYDVLLLLPFSGKIVPIWQEMLGVDNKNVTTTSEAKYGFWLKTKVFFQFVNLLVTCPKKMKKLNAFFAEKLPTYERSIADANSGTSLLRLYEELMEDLSGKWDITLVNDMYAFIFTALAKKKYGEELAAVKELESMKPVYAIQKLIACAKENGVESLAYKELEKDYIEKYGDRCPEELKLETKTFRTNPELFIEYMSNQKQEIMVETEQKPKKVKGFVKKARMGIRNREISRMNRSRIFGMAREIMLKLGTLLREKGTIAESRDIFYLYKDEIYEAIQLERDYKETVRSRKIQFSAYEKLPAYSRLHFVGEVKQKQVQNLADADIRVIGEHKLQGTPSSGGIVTAPAVVIASVDEKIDTSGKILVTKTTDPGWVLLIRNSLGVISEKGSILSHTAIITRELGKPSVVAVKNVTEVIHTGDVVELNGNTGEIHIVHRV